MPLASRAVNIHITACDICFVGLPFRLTRFTSSLRQLTPNVPHLVHAHRLCFEYLSTEIAHDVFLCLMHLAGHTHRRPLGYKLSFAIRVAGSWGQRQTTWYLNIVACMGEVRAAEVPANEGSVRKVQIFPNMLRRPKHLPSKSLQLPSHITLSVGSNV